MAKVTAPVEGFTGIVGGVDFVDGVADTDDETALAYFERQGYEVAAAPKRRTTTKADDK